MMVVTPDSPLVDQLTDSIKIASRVISFEADALTKIVGRLNSDFLNCLDFLYECEGKIIVIGLGKSGIAGKKIAATFASTGSPALFLHAAEAVHGDMGVISKSDVAIALSYSGETQELLSLIPRFKLLGVPIISITGNPASSLAKLSDSVLDVSVKSQPFPFGVIPTASYITTVAIGDALAIALLAKRGIKEDDFAMLHPGGLLGTKMLAKVEELMHLGEDLPIVRPDTNMKDVLLEMTTKRLGAACVVSDNNLLRGIITDGDLRRVMERYADPLSITAEDAMTRSPAFIAPDALTARALHEMESRSITSLPVVDGNTQLIGLIHMHDIIRQETKK